MFQRRQLVLVVPAVAHDRRRHPRCGDQFLRRLVFRCDSPRPVRIEQYCPLMTTEGEQTIIDAQTVVLVEGVSDQLAVEALAERFGRNLAAEGVMVLPMGGATNIGHFLDRFGPRGSGVRIAGLCDEAEAGVFRRGLERVGLGLELATAGMHSLGFYVCAPDLEAELIRALGVSVVEQILAGEGDLASFRTFQQQPAQRGKSDQARLRRFMGTRGGRKIHYAPLLVRSLEPARVPRPLRDLLHHI